MGIAYSEFLAAALQSRVKVHEDVMRKTFERFDEDGSGEITAKDLKIVLGEEFDAADIDDMIKEVDLNNDGMIDYDEFLAYFNDEEKPDDGESKPVTEIERKKKRQNTQKLGALLDKMIQNQYESSPMHGASESSPMRRK